MNAVRERNQEVLQMSQAGVFHREIALKFHVSTERIRQILREFEAEKSLCRRSHQLREEIRQADDLDKKWAVADLVDALRLITVTKNALMNHFQGSQMHEISLRELMDLAISDCSQGYSMTPLLGVRSVGKKGYWSVVNGLTDLDLGERCNPEWSRRLEKLKRGWRIRGATPYSETKRFEPPPE